MQRVLHRYIPVHKIFSLFVSLLDLQKAHDTVQHGLLWARLEDIGVCPKMLAAITSLYASGTLSMKVGGAAGPSLVQQNGVRQGCPLSPTSFGIFFDGLHGHLGCSWPHVHTPRGVTAKPWQMGICSCVRRGSFLAGCWAAEPSGQHACLLNGLGVYHQPFKDRGHHLQWQQL